MGHKVLYIRHISPATSRGVVYLPHITCDKLPLEGSWDILNTNKWADTLQWLGEKLDMLTLL